MVAALWNPNEKAEMTRERKKKQETLMKISVFSSCLLATSLSAYFFSPIIKTHADDSNTENVDVVLSVDSVIGIRLSTDNLDLGTTLGSFVQDSINVDVATNSPYGYSLSIEDEDDDTNMVHEDSTVDDVVTSNYLGAKTSATMADDNWGFSTDGTNFYKINPNGFPVLINSSNQKIPDNPGYATTAVHFGAKVGYNLTAGTYDDTVLFTAYVNDALARPANKTYLFTAGANHVIPIQNFDCSTLSDGQKIKLTDLRDNEVYSVVKTQGSCWMAENLRLDGPRTLTSELSNVTRDFDIPASSIENFNGFNKNALYINEYGGLYIWYTATAGIGTQAFQDTSEESICPAGWHLPSKLEYEDIILAYTQHGIKDAFTSDIGFTKGGNFFNKVERYKGSSGQYWTATGDSSSEWTAYYFGPRTSPSFGMTGTYDKYYGMSVRCKTVADGSLPRGM